MAKGATRQEWDLFDLVLGLTEDLLPVVSDQSVTISPNSKMKGLGKTPSLINRAGHAVGFTDWTSYVATDADIKRWSADPRLGGCLQTRIVRALDFDITKLEMVQAMLLRAGFWLGDSIPTRTRSDSSKCLILFELEGDFTKRSFKTEHGIVEFLATGQQCIVAGTHTGGARYEWNEFTEIPKLTPEQFEALWRDLVTGYAVEPEEQAKPSNKKEKFNEAVNNDPVARHLVDNNWVYSIEKDGRINIRCPFEGEHTSESSESATVYYPANTGGFARGHFDCKHAHCQSRTDEEFQGGVGFNDLSFDDFTGGDEGGELGEGGGGLSDLWPGGDAGGDTYPIFRASEYIARAPQGYHIKHVIPRADMVMIYGPPQSGKSFMAYDMAAAIARGTEWRGHRVTKGVVVYLIAEGSGGFGARIKAYADYHGVDMAEVDLYVIPATPNFMQAADIKRLLRTITDLKPDVIFVDTWAQVTAGGNENSGEDMGKALANARRLKNATGATVVIIHHSGKDEGRGARGWSGLKGAADAEMEVARSGDDRVLSVTKMKEGLEGGEFGFKLNVVTVWQDIDGDDITSCVCLPNEVSRAAVGMGRYERVVFEAARDAAGLDGQLPDVLTVIDAAITNIPYDPEVDKRDRRRDLVTRAYRKCIERNFLAEVDGRVECK